MQCCLSLNQKPTHLTKIISIKQILLFQFLTELIVQKFQKFSSFKSVQRKYNSRISNDVNNRIPMGVREAKISQGKHQEPLCRRPSQSKEV